MDASKNKKKALPIVKENLIPCPSVKGRDRVWSMTYHCCHLSFVIYDLRYTMRSYADYLHFLLPIAIVKLYELSWAIHGAWRLTSGNFKKNDPTPVSARK